MFKKVKRQLKQNDMIYNNYISVRDLYREKFVSNKQYIVKQYENKLGYKPNLENPTLYNDKIQWLKLNWESELATICADKYEVRNFVKNKIGEEYLNTLYWVAERTEEINFDNLPEKFVLKGTHGSGFNIICSDKSKFDKSKAMKEISRWLKVNFYWGTREPVYKNIIPRVIAEKFIEQEDGMELRDYRFFCFNGEPKFITVDFNITDKSKTRRNLYDLDWNLLDAEITYPKETNFKVPKPKKLHEMIELSKKLSEDFPHARIDFYYIDEKIIFGEITFFHQSGTGIIKPRDFEKQMGDWLELPKK